MVNYLVDSSSDSESAESSDDDDEVAFALHELATLPKETLGCRINLQDLTELECEQLFRLTSININRYDFA